MEYRINSFKYRGYDHIHWSEINGKKICREVGTLSQPKSKDDGKMVLLGRGRDGYHHTLVGPITKIQWKKEYGISSK
jgi:hypothetical protein